MKINLSVLLIVLICIITSCSKSENNEITVEFTSYVKEYSELVKDTIEGINIKFINNKDSSVYIPANRNSIYFAFNTVSEIDCGTEKGFKSIPTHHYINWIELRPNEVLNLIYRTKLELLKYSDAITVTGDYKNTNGERIQLKMSCYINKGKTLENVIYSDTFCRELREY